MQHNHPSGYRNVLWLGLALTLVVAIAQLSLSESSPANGGNVVARTSQPATVKAAAILPAGTLSASGSGKAQPVTNAPEVAQLAAAAPQDIKAYARMRSAQLFGDQHWTSLERLWQRESNWNPSARNGSSGACGIPQALPCSKITDMSSRGQVEWGLAYIKGRYGNPGSAWSFWQRKHWY